MFKFLASALLVIATIIPAHAQKTKAALATEISTNWPDNTNNKITPRLLRSVVLDIVNSYYDLNGGTSLACAAHQWVAGLPTLSSLACTQPTVSDISGFGTGVATALGNAAGGTGGFALTSQIAGAGVSSFNTRTGAVVPGSSDYTAPQISYTPPGTGGVQTTVDTELRRAGLWAKDFGAVGDGTTDDTTALQNWINACQSNKVPGFLNAGTYKITTALSVTGGIVLRGAGALFSGSNGSMIVPSPSISGITVVTQDTVHLSDFAINYPTPAAAGTFGVSLSASGGLNNTHSLIEHLFINQAFDAIGLLDAIYFTVSDCYIANVGHSGALLNNTNIGGGDSGDATIERCVFATAGNVVVGPLHQSFGGMRFINNKIVGDNSGGSTGYAVLLASGAIGSDILIANNSIENVGVGVLIVRAGATGTITNVQINSNEFELSPGSTAGVEIPSDPNGNFLTALTINSNIFYGPATGSNFGVILGVGEGFSIVSNIMIANNGSGGFTPITTTAPANNGVIAFNQRGGSGTVGANSITSTNTTVVSPN